MPKPSQAKHPLQQIREVLDLSQPELAKRLGVSASTIKKIEARKRSITPDLNARLYAETGVMLADSPFPSPFSYTREDFENWKAEATLTQKQAEALAHILGKLPRLMLIAATRPGVGKGPQVTNALIQAYERIKSEFGLDPHIQGHLKDANSTETRLYTVRELRENPLLAQDVGFEDNPNLRDDQTLPLTRAVGWIPTKEVLSIFWRNRDALAAANAALRQGGDVPAEMEAKLEQVDQEIDAQVNRFAPR